MDLEPGAVLAGRFSIEAPLGRGALGEVYRAIQIAMQRAVALKLLRAESLRSEHAHRRFEREAQLLGRLAHPNIVQVFDFGIDDGTNRPFIALELVVGETLLERLRGGGPTTEAAAARICEQIAFALAHAHAQGVVHRDLKPANVMLTDPADGRPSLVKVLDFGLGKLLEPEEAKKRLTTPGQLLGTPSFASPEQALGDDVDERSDLYALGCLAFALVAGRAPHAAPDPLEALRKKRTDGAPELPAALADGAPPSPAFDTLYRHLLERRPRDRPASAREVAQRFTAIAEDAEQRTAALPVTIPDGPTDVATRATQVATRNLAPGVSTEAPEHLPDTVPGVADEGPEHLPDTAPGAPDTALTAPGAKIAFAPGLPGPQSGAFGPEPRTSRSPLVFAALAAVVALAAFAAANLKTPAAPTTTAPTTTAPAPTTTAAPRIEVAPRPIRRVRIESSPPGAEVTEGGARLGVTPLELELAPDRLPRTLSLALRGHRPTNLVVADDGPRTLRAELDVIPRRAPPPPKAPPTEEPEYPVW